jgi:hypothetical protein
MAIESSLTLYMTDFGMVELPQHLAEHLRTVPKRKDRGFDRRFKAGKTAWCWARRVNEVATAIWTAGGEMMPADFPEIEEAGKTPPPPIRRSS